MPRPTFARLVSTLIVFALVATSLTVALSAAGAGAVPASHARVSAPAPRASGVRTSLAGPSSYLITFSESGLPSGLTWQVKVGSMTSSTTTDGLTDSVLFSDHNGSYAYTVSGISGWQQSTLPYHGTVVVAGSAVTEPTLVYSQVTYAVNFAESGLPSGQTFSVTLNATTMSLTTDGATDTLTFQFANGTWPYVVHGISGWTQSTIPYHGSVVVNGAAVTKPTLVYTQVTYRVSFSESGLPAGLTFSVTLNGVQEQLTTTSGKGTLNWTGLPNGTYPYSIAKIGGWQQATLPPTGSVVVSGSNLVEPTLAYVKSTFAVTFSETGLPPGQLFEVMLGSGTESVISDGGTDHVQFAEPNGSYSYRIDTISGWNQATLPYHGSVLVAGASVDEPTVLYTQVTYTITYTESGLPAATNWSFTLNGVTMSTNTTMLTFVDPNGSYAFKVGYIAGFATAHETGTQAVNGANLNLGVPFSQVTYLVNFQETGLPGGSHWSVHVDSQSPSSSTPTVSLQLPNGTFDYSVPSLPGYEPNSENGSVLVNGGETNVSVPFHLVTYSITFNETGLPASKHPKSWSVSVGNTIVNSTSTSISFEVGNGTYTYLIRGPSGFWVSSVLAPEGTFVVNGASIEQGVVFLKGATGHITLHEVGLGSGTKWCVTIGAQLCSKTPRISLSDLTPGTYSYDIRAVPGLQTLPTQGKNQLPTSGSISLAHSALIRVAFAYAVTFTETGLPAHTLWVVKAGHTTTNSTTNTIVIYLTNGTSAFHVGKLTGYSAAPAAGGVKVAGAPLSVSIKFTVKT